MPCIIGANAFDVLQTWVDASYAIHHNLCGHTGRGMSLVIGIINSKSTKQKLNTKSSTESEVVGASDYLPYTIWTKKFLQAQGYNIKTNILILLEDDNSNSIRVIHHARQKFHHHNHHN